MMKHSYEGKNYWALILGGSSGLGLASARKLAKHGMNVCIIHRDSRSKMDSITKDFEEIEKESVEFLALNIDATRVEKIALALKKLAARMGSKGKIRCLLNSIARGNLKPMIDEKGPELTIPDFKITMDYMAWPLYQWTKALYQNELLAKDSRVISFTSEGSSRVIPYYGAVSASKAVLETITRQIAFEFAPFGIRANCIQAGVTYTSSQDLIPGSRKMREFSKRRNPFGRITTPEDVADVAYLLCLDEAHWINGAVIPVDGGESIN